MEFQMKKKTSSTTMTMEIEIKIVIEMRKMIRPTMKGWSLGIGPTKTTKATTQIMVKMP
jgi:hypothetical protein